MHVPYRNSKLTRVLQESLGALTLALTLTTDPSPSPSPSPSPNPSQAETAAAEQRVSLEEADGQMAQRARQLEVLQANPNLNPNSSSCRARC